MISQLLIMVMQGAHEEDPFPIAVFLFRIPEIADLYNYAQALHQEHAAEDGYQPFFPDDDGEGGNDAAKRQASRIAHEHLRRVGVIPEKAYAGPDERADKYGQLAQVGDVHDVEIFREPDIAAGIREHPETGAHDRAGAGGQAIQSVGEIGPVGYRRD